MFIASHAVVSGASRDRQQLLPRRQLHHRGQYHHRAILLIGAGAVILDSTSEKQLFIGPKSVAAKISTDDLKKIEALPMRGNENTLPAIWKVPSTTTCAPSFTKGWKPSSSSVTAPMISSITFPALPAT
ncbi:MAG: hypothetical protein R3F38_03830 [Gammaproteobacteria bacterium]